MERQGLEVWVPKDVEEVGVEKECEDGGEVDGEVDVDADLDDGVFHEEDEEEDHDSWEELEGPELEIEAIQSYEYQGRRERVVEAVQE